MIIQQEGAMRKRNPKLVVSEEITHYLDMNTRISLSSDFRLQEVANPQCLLVGSSSPTNYQSEQTRADWNAQCRYRSN